MGATSANGNLFMLYIVGGCRDFILPLITVRYFVDNFNLFENSHVLIENSQNYQ